MYQRISILFLISLTFNFSGFTQNLEKDFEAILRQMDLAKSIAIDVAVKAYTQKGGQLIYSTKASVTKMGKNSMNVLGELELLTTSKYDLKIDHEEKAILILNKDSINDQIVPELSDIDIRQLKKYFKKHQGDVVEPQIKLLSNVNGVKQYAITSLQGMAEMQIHLNANTNQILKVTYEYGSGTSKGQYVVLDYSKFQYNVDQLSVFDLTAYFTIVDGTYVLSPRLKGYKIYTER